jgi:phospholipid-binding lipoprotein MlaA
MKTSWKRYHILIATTLSLGISSTSVLADVLNEALSAPVGQNEAQQKEPIDSPSQSASSEDTASEEGPNDPLEPLNQFVFALNEIFDFVLLRPVAEIYRAITPDPVMHGISNVLDNLYSPVNFLNHVLQAEPERATVTFFRFLMNSSFGIFGLVDVTSDMGYPRYDTDFNQTLMTWGVDTGPYLVLPLIGPSSFRGAVGFVGDYYADPLNLYLMNRHHWKYHYWLTVRYGLDMVRNREKVIEAIDNTRNGSLDFYVTMRSIYFQRQAYLAEKLKSANTPESAKGEEKANTS